MFFLALTSRTRHTRAGCERCKRCGMFLRFPTITRARWRITNFRRPNKMGLRSLNRPKTVPSMNFEFSRILLGSLRENSYLCGVDATNWQETALNLYQKKYMKKYLCLFVCLLAGNYDYGISFKTGDQK